MNLPGRYKNIGPLMLIFPFEILFIKGLLHAGSTVGDQIPLIDFSRDKFGMKVGDTNILFNPARSNKWEWSFKTWASKIVLLNLLLILNFPGREETLYGDKLSSRE